MSIPHPPYRPDRGAAASLAGWASAGTVLLVLAVALLATPAAGARDRPTDRKPSVAPAHRVGGMTGGELLGEVWVWEFEMPVGENPFSGSCVPIAPHVLVAAPGEDGTAICTATRGTQLFVYFGFACSNVEPPLFAKTEEEQRACAVANDQGTKAINVTVDKGKTVNIVRRRFELFSPQRTAQLPAGKVEDVPAGPVTFTAHAWGAVIRRLRPGRHTVEVQVVALEFEFTITITLDVTRPRHPVEEKHGDED